MKEHTRLHEDNLSYWSQRSASYSDVNKGELAGISRHSWSAVLHDAISSHYPGRPAESIRVLDIGTGPGFFAIVLAEQGYSVTAVVSAIYGRYLGTATMNTYIRMNSIKAASFIESLPKIYQLFNDTIFMQ